MKSIHMSSVRSQAGFTLVELITVILILGILAATALPRFLDVTDQAHEAAVAGAGGGFGSGVAIVHAQWVANGITGAVNNVQGFGNNDVDVNASGWPIGTSAGTCIEVWNGVMQNPPTVEAGTTKDYNASDNSIPTCTFAYCNNKQNCAAPDMSITYDALNGNVVVDAESP